MAFKRPETEIKTLSDKDMSKIVLQALGDSLKGPKVLSVFSDASKPWTVDCDDMFECISIVDDGLSFRLEDCMI